MTITKANWRDVFHAKKATVETMELKGYTIIDELFVDSSGFGAPDEPALTSTGEGSQLERRLAELLDMHGTLTAKITREGQFQVYVGLFKKTGKSISKRIANNTLEIRYPDGRKAYRLHDTDIVTYMPNGDIKLDTGGWDTMTTRKRMREYLPHGISIWRRNGMSYVVDTKNDNSMIPLCDGMVLKGYTV